MGNLQCFECADVGHKRRACSHKSQADQTAGTSSVSAREEINTNGVEGKQQSVWEGKSNRNVKSVHNENSEEETGEMGEEAVESGETTGQTEQGIYCNCVCEQGSRPEQWKLR